jgi:ergothioneine biosynthesis protein EgtB
MNTRSSTSTTQAERSPRPRPDAPRTPATEPILSANGQGLSERFLEIRAASERLCQPLSAEDCGLQSMPEASPVKWHLAHTTWFFETFLLLPHLPGYEPFHPRFNFLFNSYYNSVGTRWPRAERGLLSRPTLAEVFDYRIHVDHHVQELLRAIPPVVGHELATTLVLGLNHEQQHQELILTDLKHAWAANPLEPVYRQAPADDGRAPKLQWLEFPAELRAIGHEGDGFAFDNESPRHREFVPAFRLASRLVTNGEYRAFIDDGGYRRPEWWLSDGWAAREAGVWRAPLYWHDTDGDWMLYTLSGTRRLVADEPVCHVSFYEADAFARWAEARLPSEAEWETAACVAPVAGHFVEGGRFHPAAAPAADDTGSAQQLSGDVWQWTASPYLAYPGYRPAAGALGEYNSCCAARRVRHPAAMRVRPIATSFPRKPAGNSAAFAWPRSSHDSHAESIARRRIGAIIRPAISRRRAARTGRAAEGAALQILL